jgi:hypothetical protein
MLTYDGPHLIHIPTRGRLDLHERTGFRAFVSAVLMDSDREPHPYGKQFIRWAERRFGDTIAEVAKAVQFLYGREQRQRFFETLQLGDTFV